MLGQRADRRRGDGEEAEGMVMILNSSVYPVHYSR